MQILINFIKLCYQIICKTAKPYLSCLSVFNKNLCHLLTFSIQSFQNSNDTLESILKIKKNEFLDDDDDDDGSGNYEPETLSNGKHRRNKLQSSTGPKKRKKREEKVLHPCDQCDAKYTSLCEYSVTLMYVCMEM